MRAIEKKREKLSKISCVDLFCGAGGLTHGFVKEGFNVVAGIDLDPACKYPYEKNNGAKFIESDVSAVTKQGMLDLFADAEIKILAGCAPCQPFSTYANRYEIETSDGSKWALLYQFARLIRDTLPEIVTMENVPTVANHEVFQDFVSELEVLNYSVWYGVIDCSKYGVPQSRKRMVLLASQLGDIDFIAPTTPKPKTVRSAIGKLEEISAGSVSPSDPLHVTASLSALNLRRIRASVAGGSWKTWPEDLIANCHQSDSGKTFGSVYGRMEWDKPSPTMTTQCYGFGNGRFGHPEQDRAISLREAAILQSFPKSYAFIPKNGEASFTALGRLIGNAVPVNLGRAVAKSIETHLFKHGLIN